MLITSSARAYVNHGRWVADCPNPECANAMALHARQIVYECGGDGGCRTLAEIVWPPDADEIWDALAERPVPATRNWYPASHPIASRAGLPSGQTPDALRDETREHITGGA